MTRRLFEEQKATFETQQVEMLSEIERLKRALEAAEGLSEHHAAELAAAHQEQQQEQRNLAAAEATITTLREEVTHLREAGTRLEDWMARAATAEAELKMVREAQGTG